MNAPLTKANILKMLVTICWRFFNSDKCRIFRRSAVALAYTTGSATAGKIRIHELSNNGYSVLDIPNFGWEKPPPFVRVKP